MNLPFYIMQYLLFSGSQDYNGRNESKGKNNRLEKSYCMIPRRGLWNNIKMSGL